MGSGIANAFNTLSEEDKYDSQKLHTYAFSRQCFTFDSGTETECN